MVSYTTKHSHHQDNDLNQMGQVTHQLFWHQMNCYQVPSLYQKTLLSVELSTLISELGGRSVGGPLLLPFLSDLGLTQTEFNFVRR